MSFPEVIFGAEGDQFRNTEGAKGMPLGAIMQLKDGRQFIFARNGGVELAGPGRLTQQAVVVSGHTTDLAVAVAAAVGATAITLTNSTTAIVIDEYAGGWLWVNDQGASGTGEGQLCKIKSHPAESTGSGSIVITLEEDYALRVALTTDSQVGLRRHKSDDVLVAPTTFTGVLVGVSQVLVTAAFYSWFQFKGSCPVLTNGTVISGLAVTRSATTAGAVDVYPLNSVDGSGQQPMVGYVESVAPTTEYSLIDLRL